MIVTHEEVEAAKTPKGAWTKAQLAQWGVPWPPPKGWRGMLERGERVPGDADVLLLCEPICKSCTKKFGGWPAAYVASAERIDNLPPIDWPVCESHMQAAMCAGWFPIRTIAEWLVEKGATLPAPPTQKEPQ